MTLPQILGFIHSYKKFFLYFVISQIVILLSNHQLLQEMARTPQGKINLMVHRDWPQDYFSHLAYITQGETGSWLRYTPYGTEESKPGIFHIYLISVGKAGAIFKLPPYIVYHIFRILVVEFFIFGLYAFAKSVLGANQAWLGALFGLLGTIGSPFFLRQQVQVTWYPYGYPWWEDLDALQRLYLPSHHVLGQALMLWACYFFLSWLTQPKALRLFGFIGTLFLGVVTFPPVLLPFAVAAGPAFGIYIVRESLKRRKLFFPQRLFFGLVAAGGLTIILYFLLSYQERQGYPWNLSKPQEIARWNSEPSFDPAMPYIFGILPVLALPAIIRGLILGTWQDLFLVFWGVLPYVMLPFADVLQFPKIRLVHENPYVPLALLSVQTIVLLDSYMKRKFFHSLLPVLFFATTIPISFYHLYFRVKSVDYFLTHGDTRHYYISPDAINAFRFIREQLPKKSVVLSDFPTGNMLPGFAPIISVFGHQADTLDFDGKRYHGSLFFKGLLTFDETKQFLAAYSVSYIYFGTNEKNNYGQKDLKYPFLRLIYRQGDIDIYKVE